MEMIANERTTPLGTYINDASDPRASRSACVRARRIPGASKIKFRFASWNVGSMTGKSLELEEVLVRRGIDILCVQETKWANTGNRSRFLDLKSKGFKLFYYGTQNGRNGIGIVVRENLLGNIIGVDKTSDRLMSLKIVIEDRVWNIVSAYAPQVGCEQREKDDFWLSYNAMLAEIPNSENIFVGADLNGHVGQSNLGFEEVHGGKGYGERNDAGLEIIESCIAHELCILNTMFIKQQRHLIT